MRIKASTQFTFAASSADGAAVTIETMDEREHLYALPAVDPDAGAVTVENVGRNTAYLRIVGMPSFLPVSPGDTVLLMTGDGSLGDGIARAVETQIAGHTRLIITRGTATTQQVFAETPEGIGIR